MNGPTVEFKSTAFPKYADEDDEIINSNRWGKRLAEFVRDNLPKYDTPTEDILCEDWGWLVYVKNEGFPLWVGCGPMDDPSMYEGGNDADEQTHPATRETKDQDLTEFCMFVAAEPGFFKRLFKKVDTAPDVNRVVDALKKMVNDSPQFQDVKWIE